MADNTNGTRTSTISEAADIKPKFFGNIYTYEKDLLPSWQNRPETYDIGAEDSPMRVQGVDTYIYVRGERNFDAGSEQGNSGRQSVALTKPGEKRAQFEQNTLTNFKRMREMTQLIGKQLVCSQCKDVDPDTGEVTLNCTWHMSAVANVMVKLEVFARQYLADLKAAGRLVAVDVPVVEAPAKEPAAAAK